MRNFKFGMNNVRESLVNCHPEALVWVKCLKSWIRLVHSSYHDNFLHYGFLITNFSLIFILMNCDLKIKTDNSALFKLLSQFITIASKPTETVAMPTLNPAAGTYDTAQTIALSTKTSGATIYYTLNGSMPTTASTQYTTGIAITVGGSTTTIQAIAVKAGMIDSNITSGTYVMNFISPPVFNPPEGIYNSDQLVTIDTPTFGATIYYTLDGLSFSSSSPQYTTPISIAGNGTTKTIKAIAVKSGFGNSPTVSGTWTIDTTIPTVTVTAPTVPYVSNNAGAINTKDISWSSYRNGTYSINVGGADCTSGTVLSSGSVTASAANTYTLNASSLSVGANTIRFCVVDARSGHTGSNTTTVTRDDTAPTVTANPGSSSSATLVNVTLSCSDASSGCDKISYTSTGSDPAITGTTGAITSGTQYTSQLTPADNAVTTYKYLSRDNAGNVSSIQSSAYTVDTSIAIVTINSVSPSTIMDVTTNPQINWQSNESGTYTVRIGGANCTDGTLATGTNVSGSILANTAITTTINSVSLSSGINTIRICGMQNLIGIYGYNTQNIIQDNAIPVVGNSGIIRAMNGTSTSIILDWTKATDTYTAQPNLQYKVVRSLYNDIGTVQNAEINGTLVQDWTMNINTLNVTGLTANTVYFFNVLVKDNAGKAIYLVDQSNTETYSWGTFTDNFNGTISFIGAGSYAGQNLTWMKCSQGQAWNSSNNDCTGLGNSSNNYNAGTYKYCLTNDNSCNSTITGLLNGSGNSSAYTTCNTLVFAGISNWRVPTIDEFKTLIHCNDKTMPTGSNMCVYYTSPTINNIFPNIVVSNNYWSSFSNLGYGITTAWLISFNIGVIGTQGKTYDLPVLCVSP
ncbi:MAG: chitobiase/beta-hexosaminidase C-terminal domain-containing protein [Leptospiraceae bacterium]|nr:chitobiase/beta-hexosaminidase C-terminal domain-containing protein [Leptospiraceae bacterium]